MVRYVSQFIDPFILFKVIIRIVHQLTSNTLTEQPCHLLFYALLRHRLPSFVSHRPVMTRMPAFHTMPVPFIIAFDCILMYGPALQQNAPFERPDTRSTSAIRFDALSAASVFLWACRASQSSDMSLMTLWPGTYRESRRESDQSLQGLHAPYNWKKYMKMPFCWNCRRLVLRHIFVFKIE